MAKKKGKKRKSANKSRQPTAEKKSDKEVAKKGGPKKATAKEPPAKKSETRNRLWIYLVPPFLIIAVYLGLSNIFGWNRGADSAPISGTEAKAKVAGEALSEAPQILKSVLEGSGKPTVSSARFGERNHGVYLAFRLDGQLVVEGWEDQQPTVRDSIAELAKVLAKSKANMKADTAELCITHSYRQIADGDRRSHFGNIFRGVRGLELETAKGPRRLSPTQMIARNFKYDRALQALAKAERLGAADVSDESLRTFECDQMLINLEDGTAVSMYRGNNIVPISSVNRETTKEFLDLMILWLTNHVHPNGRMTYKWWPSVGKEAPSNNMIRQWMATAALGLIGHDRKDQSVFDLAEKNIDYNLAKFYRKDKSGHGYIFFNGKAKLGAMALAAYSIYIHPKRDKWKLYEDSMLKTIYALLQDSGRYTTFWVPKGRNDNENFYPGETQLYLATRYVDEKDPEMLERIMRAFRFYRQWHRDNKNPAFIPWHTQAYFTLWEVTKDQELVDFIFEMNDWLIDTMQQWKGARTPDAKGRFYNPKKRYGPPHASSTGVYLEGLIDAYKLARELGDDERRKKYGRAMVRGLRSSMQLQFADNVDMFYVRQKDKVRGGMRTTIYDNAIRVDNVQHTLMGVLKIVREISDEDWAYGITE